MAPAVLWSLWPASSKPATDLWTWLTRQRLCSYLSKMSALFALSPSSTCRKKPVIDGTHDLTCWRKIHPSLLSMLRSTSEWCTAVFLAMRCLFSVMCLMECHPDRMKMMNYSDCWVICQYCQEPSFFLMSVVLDINGRLVSKNSKKHLNNINPE